MQVVLGQMDIVWENASANVARVTAALEQVEPRVGSLERYGLPGYARGCSATCDKGCTAVGYLRCRSISSRNRDFR